MGTITSGPVRYCAWFVIGAFVLASVLVACSDGDQKPTVVEPGRGFTALSAGAYHTCAITTDARVMCWGANRDGQLGIKPSGDLEQRAYLVEGLGEVKALAAAGDRTCALTNGGAVLCWGTGGSLGSGDSRQSHTPVPVVGLSSGVTAIAAAGRHACALLDNGRVKCWGQNLDFELGDGTRQDRLAPVEVVGLHDPVRAIYANGLSSCAELVTGGVQCWGQPVYSVRGRGGNRIESQSPDPRPVEQFGAHIEGMRAAGSDSVCFLTDAHAARCFGYNITGILGNGTKVDAEIPTDVVGLGDGLRDIDLGAEHACAVTSVGAVKCWGLLRYRENWGLREASVMKNADYGPVPVAIPGLEDGVIAVATGVEHMCVLREAGNIQCWGHNFFGQLGNGTIDASAAPVELQLASSQ